MDPVVGILAKRAAGWWLRNRPFSKEKRDIRKRRRALRRKNRERKKLGLAPLVLPEEPLMETGLRTSTVAAIVGAVSLVIMKMLGAFAPEFVAAVPGLDETVAAIAAYLAARLNKTPAEPKIL